jgi:hypothetical protein
MRAADPPLVLPTSEIKAPRSVQSISLPVNFEGMFLTGEGRAKIFHP